MLRKVLATFMTLVILLFLLTSCRQTTTGPIPDLYTETPINTPTERPTPAESTISTPVPMSTVTPEPLIETKPAITDENLITQKVFTELSSPELKGRVMGSDGSEKALSLIRELFVNLNLEPFGEDYISPIFRDPFRKVPSQTSSKGDGYNVIGFLEGQKQNECLIISAHYDGNENGPSALDNASGVYGLLRVAEKISARSRENAPERDIIFAAFDGEELGLLGSSYMADRIKESYENVIVINFDCIGIKENDSYMVAGNRTHFEALVDSLYQQLDLYGFTTVPAIDTVGSDHLPFEWQYMPAVTIGETDMEGIVHTSRDTAEVVSIVEVERLADAIYFYILEQLDEMYDAF